MPRLALIFEGQWLHLLFLVLAAPALLAAGHLGSVRTGSFGGLQSRTWLWIALAVPVAHQTLVWFCWRTQLHASLPTRILGRQGGFAAYAAAFAILGIGRLGTILCLALANRGTLQASTVASRALAVMLSLPVLYLFYSVRRYFGFRRALGIDHFDPSYRSRPLVRQGIFRFTANGMYVFGFLVLWIPGLWYASAAALIAALFSHLYIWVHYLSTERPDMRRIHDL